MSSGSPGLSPAQAGSCAQNESLKIGRPALPQAQGNVFICGAAWILCCSPFSQSLGSSSPAVFSAASSSASAAAVFCFFSGFCRRFSSGQARLLLPLRPLQPRPLRQYQQFHPPPFTSAPAAPYLRNLAVFFPVRTGCQNIPRVTLPLSALRSTASPGIWPPSLHDAQAVRGLGLDIKF